MASQTSLQLLAFNSIKKKSMHIHRQSLLNKATKYILYSTQLNEIMNRHRQGESNQTYASGA